MLTFFPDVLSPYQANTGVLPKAFHCTWTGQAEFFPGENVTRMATNSGLPAIRDKVLVHLQKKMYCNLSPYPSKSHRPAKYLWNRTTLRRWRVVVHCTVATQNAKKGPAVPSAFEGDCVCTLLNKVCCVYSLESSATCKFPQGVHQSLEGDAGSGNSC